MISGFMILKDVLRQGYPFVEAIASALPICDEFLVSDGYSTDGTYEALQKIAAHNPKVKLEQQQWPKRKDVTILSEVTNRLRGKCRYDYILYLQANEVIHQDSAPFIKALPEMFPSVDTFSFPFIQFLSIYKFAEGFRLRFSKNNAGIVAKGDAWTLGASSKFVRSKALRALARPRRFYHYVAKGVEFVHANPCFDYRSRAIYLPNPVFRYWAVFPQNFLEKAQRHGEMFPLDKFHKSYDKLKANLDNPEVFWRLGKEFLEFSKDEHYPDAFGYIEKQKHPEIMHELISNQEAKAYYVREEMYTRIAKL